MKIYNKESELIADAEQAKEMCEKCPYHEITAEGKHICQISNETITDDFECQRQA